MVILSVFWYNNYIIMLENIIQLIIYHKYLIIIPVTIVEGPIVSFLSGFLVQLGVLNFFYAYICLMIGDLIGDVAWYWLGCKWGMPFIRKFGKYFSLSEEKIQPIHKLFHKYHTSVLFISKLATGFGFAPAVLFTAGMTRIPFSRYLTLNFFGQFIWTALLLFLGFFIGHLYESFNSILERVSIFVIVAACFFLIVGFGKYLRGRIINKTI